MNDTIRLVNPLPFDRVALKESLTARMKTMEVRFSQFKDYLLIIQNPTLFVLFFRTDNLFNTFFTFFICAGGKKTSLCQSVRNGTVGGNINGNSRSGGGTSNVGVAVCNECLLEQGKDFLLITVLDRDCC